MSVRGAEETRRRDHVGAGGGARRRDRGAERGGSRGMQHAAAVAGGALEAWLMQQRFRRLGALDERLRAWPMRDPRSMSERDRNSLEPRSIGGMDLAPRDIFHQLVQIARAPDFLVGLV
jgi:hypothetical protein